MIQFFATQDHFYTLREFVDSWMPEQRTDFREIPYEKFPVLKPVPNGVCIFTDLERLLPGELRLAGKLAAALRARPERYTVINDPGHYLGRLRLLKVLHESGINEFRAGRLEEWNSDWQFPVFLRSELDHNGPLTPPLHSLNELAQALKKKPFRKRALRKQFMAVEYCDCAGADGIFRKYSAMNVAGNLVPRHVLFSKNWMTKSPDIVTEATAREEMDFVVNFPHADQIRKIFQLAGVEYGRIDYGVRHGRVQVWEINTNPMIVPRREKIDPLRMAAQSRSAGQIIETLRRLSRRHENGADFPFRSRKFFAAKTLQLLKKFRRRRRRK